MMRLSLERKIQLGFAVALAVVLGAGAATLWTAAATADNTKWVVHTLKVRVLIREVQELSNDAEENVGDFVATGDSAYLAAYDSTRRALTGLVEQLRTIAADNPDQQRRADSLAGLIPARLSRLAEVVLRRGSHGQAEAVRLQRSEGEAGRAQVRGLIERMRGEEQRLLDEHAATMQAQTRRERLAAWTGTILALTAVGGANLLIRRELDTRFRDIVEASPSGMVMIDGAGKIVLVNRETERLFGYSRNELMDQPVELLVPLRFTGKHPDFRRDFFKQPQTRAMGAGRELYGLRKDGTEIPVEIGLNPIQTGGGMFVLASVVDISARQGAEARFRTVVESAPSGMVMVDRDGKITLVNKETERLFGYSRDQLLGQSIERLVPERFRGGHREVRAGFSANPQSRAMGAGRDLFGVRQDGTEFPVEIGLNPIETAEGVFVLASVVDITGRKRSEAVLRETEERLGFALQRSHTGGWDLDLENHTAHRTLDHDRIFGYDSLQAEWTYEMFLEHVIPEDRAEVDRLFQDAVARQTDWSFECRIRRTDGEVRWIWAAGGHQRDGEGPARRMAGIVQDITDRKKAEQELRRSNEELERFAYVASHDLQEPLRMVGSYVQLLGKRYRGKLDADADVFIGYALDGALRMQRLIEDLLAFSRVGTRGGALAPTDPNSVLESVLAALRLSIEETGAVVTHDPLPTVLADQGQLGHLLQNLVSNALKFRSSEPPWVHVSATRRDSQWCFSVRDNGIGIAPQYFERIFVLFQRLHSREEYGGTGIGLAIAKKIVERHGGRIWLESQPGQGTTFFFTLPASSEG